MVSKKAQQKIMKHRICAVARVVACVSFAFLAIIGVSSIVKAMSLETIANENGIPSVWQMASLGEPDSITLPITYWDQKADDCDNPDRQFEWTLCEGYRTHGVLMGMVKPRLGSDGLPVPAFSDKNASWNALRDALSENVIGHDPVLPTDNFYRWFHEVPGLSRLITGRTVTFNRTAKGTYVYGGQDIYPIDDVAGLDASDVQLKDWQGNLHNFNFTAHLGFAIKVQESGAELFEFSGDDDVWVFLNNQLVLDIGGLHGPIAGWFRINADGTVSTYVEKVNNLDIRDGAWAQCMRIQNGVYADQNCINNYNVTIRANFKDVTTQNLDLGLELGEVVNIDFFYAERSTDGSNTKITISNMNWPISADSELEAEVVGRIGDTNSNLIKFESSIKNRDPSEPLDIERIAAYIDEATEAGETSTGFLSLSSKTLYYTATPEDEDSWQPVELSAPDNSMDGFKLETPLRLAPAGKTGDTLYFRYFGESLDLDGKMSSTVSYYTSMNGNAGVTYDTDEVVYKTGESPLPPVDPDEPKEPGEIEKPVEPTEPNEPTEPSEPSGPSDSNDPEEPVTPVIPPSDIIDGDLVFWGPLGEIAYVPNTGIVSDALASVFGEGFAEVILSQGMVMAMLAIFAGSFATYFSLRKFAGCKVATVTRGMNKSASIGDAAEKVAKGAKKTVAKADKKVKKTAKKATKAVKTEAKKVARTVKKK